MGDTEIQWTDKVWNPTTGCTKVSQGCKNCYAERVFKRPYPNREFTDIRTHPDRLDQPLRWKKPKRVFVNSMSDLFHESVPDEFIDQVFAVMADAERHTFQILTKRPERMREYLSPDNPRYTARKVFDITKGEAGKFDCDIYWPLSNVHLGVSVEDQPTADERIPLLLQTPAAVRFISAEPLLSDVDLRLDAIERDVWWHEVSQPHPCDYACRGFQISGGLDWVIAGGESGTKARPCDVEWIRSIVAQCKAAGTPCFVKQLGAVPVMDEAEWRRIANGNIDPLLSVRNRYRAPSGLVPLHFDSRKGGDIEEWPADLRVREFPERMTA